MKRKTQIKIVAMKLMAFSGFCPAEPSYNIMESDSSRAKLWVFQAKEIIKALEMAQRAELKSRAAIANGAPVDKG